MAGKILRSLALLLLAGMAACHDGRPSGDALIAVATNFREAAMRLEADFEAESGYEISLAAGATGQLYAQIQNGAPYDVMLSADRRRPQMLVEDGLADADSLFTYATGKLVLWSADEALLSGVSGEAVLRSGAFRRLAIANPDLAPYGTAAMEVLTGLGLSDALAGKLVRGQTVGQAFAMVSSGNAELGLVALSQTVQLADNAGGSFWQVPSDLYSPIRQDAVLLERASSNEAARAFLAYLRSEKGRATIAQFGYETD